MAYTITLLLSMKRDGCHACIQDVVGGGSIACMHALHMGEATSARIYVALAYIIIHKLMSFSSRQIKLQSCHALFCTLSFMLSTVSYIS